MVALVCRTLGRYRCHAYRRQAGSLFSQPVIWFSSASSPVLDRGGSCIAMVQSFFNCPSTKNEITTRYKSVSRSYACRILGRCGCRGLGLVVELIYSFLIRSDPTHILILSFVDNGNLPRIVKVISFIAINGSIRINSQSHNLNMLNPFI